MPDNNGVTPPMFAESPQFTEEYWAQVPRQTIPVTVHRISTSDDGQWKHFIAHTPDKRAMTFRRKVTEVTQLVMPGARAKVELIHNELITGLYLLDEAKWAFHMTAQDLATYTREISGLVHRERQAARQLMLTQVTNDIFTALAELGLISVADDVEREEQIEYWQQAEHIALVAIGSLEAGPKLEGQ